MTVDGTAVDTGNTNVAGDSQQQGNVEQQEGQQPEAGQQNHQGGGGDQGTGEWFKSLPETYHEKLKGFESVDKAIEAMERGASYEPPKSVDDVKIQYPEGAEVDEAASASFREFCVKNGIPAKTAQALADWQIGLNAEAQKSKIAAGEEALRSQWGANYEQNKVAALKVVSALDAKTDGRFGKAFMGSTFDLANDPAAVEALYVISQMMGEDSIGAGDSGGGGGQQTLTAVDTYKGMFK